MTTKRELAIYVEKDGLEYTLTSGIHPEKIEDEKLRDLCVRARDAIEAAMKEISPLIEALGEDEDSIATEEELERWKEEEKEREREREDYRRSLYYCARTSDVDGIKAAIKEGYDINTVWENLGGKTPLIGSIENAPDVNACVVMIELGADPNLADSYGVTPLMYAAQFGLVDIVQALIKAGVDIEAEDDVGRTAKTWATVKGNNMVVKMLDGDCTHPVIGVYEENGQVSERCEECGAKLDRDSSIVNDMQAEYDKRGPKITPDGEEECPECDGTGQRIYMDKWAEEWGTKICEHCNGTGIARG